MSTKSVLYDLDFYAWSHEQAARLRAANLRDADLEHIAEEMESMGRTEKRELVSRLTMLLVHLLEWQFQPGRRGPSWEASIRLQRNRLVDHLEDNPSLRPLTPLAQKTAYRDAVLEAVAETGLEEASFPPACPWSFEQAMDRDFWPE